MSLFCWIRFTGHRIKVNSKIAELPAMSRVIAQSGANGFCHRLRLGVWLVSAEAALCCRSPIRATREYCGVNDLPLDDGQFIVAGVIDPRIASERLGMPR
jgi:hypothetical protein